MLLLTVSLSRAESPWPSAGASSYGHMHDWSSILCLWIPHTKNMEQPKITSKVPIPERYRMQDKSIPMPDYAIPQKRSGDDLSSRMIKRKTIQDISRRIPMCPDPFYRTPPKPTEISLQEVPRNLSDLDTDINMEFKENSPYQEV